MIVYNKLNSLLEERHITRTKLGEDTGLSTNIISKISKNEGFKTETINRLCEYLKVPPGDIMEWIPDSEYETVLKKQEEEKLAIQAQIEELQAKLKKL